MPEQLVCAFGEPWIGPHPKCAAYADELDRQFDAAVAAGKYDQDGYTPADRRAEQKRKDAEDAG